MWYNQGMEKRYLDLKIKATEFRKQGLSYGEIGRRLNISKSTLSFWLKEVPVSDEHKRKLYSRQVGILNMGAQSQKHRRAREISLIIENARREIVKPISLDSYKLFGAALYWAEGSKGGMLQMNNSDPFLILFWVKWLAKVFKVEPIVLKARLNIYPQQNEKHLKSFWSDLTGIPIKNFGKSYIKPLSKNYKTNNLYFGTIRVEVAKSTDLRHKVYGWTRALLEDVAPTVELVERKWERLKAVAKPVNLV